MANARAPGWYWIEQDAFESAIIPKGPWVAYWTDSGGGYWMLACVAATLPGDDETIRVLAGPLPPPSPAPERDPLSREAWRQPTVDWLRGLADVVDAGKWTERLNDARVDVGTDLLRAADLLGTEHPSRAWLDRLAAYASRRVGYEDHSWLPDHETAVNLRIVASAIERGAPGAAGPTLDELVTMLREAGFRVAKNLAHPFLGPTPEDRWTMWCCDCGRDSGFHHDNCPKAK